MKHIPTLLLILLFTMSDTTAHNKAFALWGTNARIWKEWAPDPIKGASKGHWTYKVGLQEYQAMATPTPLGIIHNPRAGQPLDHLTVKGSGGNWDKAFAAVKP